MKHSSSLPPKIQKTLGLLLCLGAASIFCPAWAQDNPGPANVRIFQEARLPQALVLSVSGPCQYSLDAKEFNTLKEGDVLKEGAVIQTGKSARVDLFFQRMATMIRLTPDTKLVLERMAKTNRQDILSMETIVDLRAGEIFCFVRGLVPNSRFEVKHSSVRSVVEGEGMGGFEIRVDSARVTPRASFIPLKVISEHGVAVIAPGQKFDVAHGKTLQLAPTEVETTLLQLDELQTLADRLSSEENLPKKE